MNEYNRPNFNDYVHTALLAANARLSYENLRAIRAAAQADADYRELQFWKSVVRDRYPDISGAMDTEDAALRLMGFDRMETEAQHNREWFLAPRTVPFRSRILGLFGIGVLSFIGYFFLISQNYPAGSQGFDNWGIAWDNSQPIGWIFMLVMFAWAVWYVSPVFVPQPSGYHPQDDSIICQTVYPGRTLQTRSGKTFRVSKTRLPEYYARRLRFDVFGDDGRMYSSDEILWDAGAINSIR